MILAKELVGESYLTLSENCDYMTNWVSVYNKYAESMGGNIIRLSTTDLPSTDKADLRTKTTELDQMLKDFREKLNFNRKMRETESMSEAHADRRQKFSAIRYYIKGHLCSLKAEEKAAATVLNNRTINFKISKARTYAATSTLITSYIEVLRSEACAAHVEALGLAPYINELEEANEKYLSLFQQRNIYKQSIGLSASVLYRDCYAYFNDLIRYLNGILRFYQHEEFGDFVGELNGITFSYQLIANSRKNGNKQSEAVSDAAPASLAPA